MTNNLQYDDGILNNTDDIPNTSKGLFIWAKLLHLPDLPDPPGYQLPYCTKTLVSSLYDVIFILLLLQVYCFL